ncbi:hypothetical protein ACNQ6O_04910 [Marinobacter sp. SBS5]|uniref:hypothetical protein n=1 Tax=Marinobacter sp. SBS5 TaxID=3401754 RepID=UPI003AAFC9EF
MDLFIAFFLVLFAFFAVSPVLLGSRWAVLPIAFAFGARISAAIFHRYVQPLPEGSSDALVFDRVAVAWATEYGCSGFFDHFNPSASYVYSSLMAVAYSCIDYVPFSVQVLNVLVGVFGVIFLMSATKTVWGIKYAKRVGYVLAFFPFLVMLSAVGLRESFIFSLFSLGIFSFVKYSYGKGNSWLILCLVSFGLSSLFHGAMALAIGGVFMGIMLKPMLAPIQTKQQFGFNIVLFLVMLAIFCLGMVYVYSQVSLHKLGSLDELDVDQISAVVSSRTKGNAAYLTGLEMNGLFDFLWQIPIRMFYFLFSPFPWNISSPAHVLGMLDGVFYIVISAMCFKYRKEIFNNPVLLQVLLILLLMSLAFSFGTSNFGTAIRHRAKFYLCMLIIVAPCFFGGWRRSNR